MRGDGEIVLAVIQKRDELAAAAAIGVEGEGAGTITAAADILDIDGADWESKMNALQYAIAFGHAGVVRILLERGANARKIAVHKDKNESLSPLSLLAFHASESGWSGSDRDSGNGDAVRDILGALLDAGASTAHVDAIGRTCWHALAANPASAGVLEEFLKADAERNVQQRGEKKKATARALDVIDHQLQSAMWVATAVGNHKAIRALLDAGAAAYFPKEEWTLTYLEQRSLLRDE